jgi:hypothetical protein
MRFEFRLRPVAEIGGWKSEDGRQHLHWFGLTDGEYWIDTGAGELFRYTNTILAHWAAAGYAHRSPYTDYFVVRLWEDVLEMLPDILAPVPAEVTELLSPGAAARDWTHDVRAALDDGDEQAHALLDTAAAWLDVRRLDTSYLVAGPLLWIWSDGAQVHLRWHNRGREIDGIPAWSATEGHVTLPADELLDEVRSFDARLIGAMADRVAEVTREWPHPDVELDLDALAREHTERARFLAQALVRPRAATDWAAVTAALRQLARIVPLPRH